MSNIQREISRLHNEWNRLAKLANKKTDEAHGTSLKRTLSGLFSSDQDRIRKIEKEQQLIRKEMSDIDRKIRQLEEEEQSALDNRWQKN